VLGSAASLNVPVIVVLVLELEAEVNTGKFWTAGSTYMPPYW
jgi:hypothetical protein